MTTRADYIHGLQNELDMLERQPKPNDKRIADVRKQLDHYSAQPAEQRVETAIPTEVVQAPADGPVDPAVTVGQAGVVGPVSKTRAPAKKAPAKAPAKKH